MRNSIWILEAMMQIIPLPPYKHKKPGQESRPGLIGKVKCGLLHRLQQPLLQPAVIDGQLRDADQDGAGGDSMTRIFLQDLRQQGWTVITYRGLFFHAMFF
jgi:hypothetical protein